jgi:hypothetical protein
LGGPEGLYPDPLGSSATLLDALDRALAPRAPSLFVIAH